MYRQSFLVTTPAADLSLLTIARLRDAAGLAVGDTSRDAELTALGLAMAADIANACLVASDGIHTPTLRSEVCTEKFWMSDCRDDEVFLSRRFVSAIGSVSETDIALVLDTDYMVEREAGILNRIYADGMALAWTYGRLTVVYTAGFATVPPDLEQIAFDFARTRLSADAADPLEKARTITIPDVETVRVDRWVGSTPGTAGPVPPEIDARLFRYKNINVG